MVLASQPKPWSVSKQYDASLAAYLLQCMKSFYLYLTLLFINAAARKMKNKEKANTNNTSLCVDKGKLLNNTYMHVLQLHNLTYVIADIHYLIGKSDN